MRNLAKRQIICSLLVAILMCACTSAKGQIKNPPMEYTQFKSIFVEFIPPIRFSAFPNVHIEVTGSASVPEFLRYLKTEYTKRHHIRHLSRTAANIDIFAADLFPILDGFSAKYQLQIHSLSHYGGSYDDKYDARQSDTIAALTESKKTATNLEKMIKLGTNPLEKLKQAKELEAVKKEIQQMEEFQRYDADRKPLIELKYLEKGAVF